MKFGKKCKNKINYKKKYFLIFKNRWIKIFHEKLLIFFKENAHKANIIYDLSECEIKKSYIQEATPESASYKRKSIASSSFKLNVKGLENVRTFNFQKRMKSYSSLNKLS